MNSCKNCYYYDKCKHESKCEYYDPIYDADNIVLEEYEASLAERAEDYQECIDDINQ